MLISEEIKNSKNQLDSIATKLVNEGIIEIAPNLETLKTIIIVFSGYGAM